MNLKMPDKSMNSGMFHYTFELPSYYILLYLFIHVYLTTNVYSGRMVENGLRYSLVGNYVKYCSTISYEDM